LPASGCEMIAKVRRRATGLGSGMGSGLGEERLSHSAVWALGEGLLFPAGPPPVVSVAVRQSELRLHIRERGQELLLDLQRMRLACELRSAER
jgi:hypothetical protein